MAGGVIDLLEIINVKNNKSQNLVVAFGPGHTKPLVGRSRCAAKKAKIVYNS
jgi:hypothetical protein